MQKPHFTQEQLSQAAKLSEADIKQIHECREAQNKVGYGYQLCHAKLFNRFPTRNPFEIVEELATFVAVQLDIPREQLAVYAPQKSTFFRHQEAIRIYF